LNFRSGLCALSLLLASGCAHQPVRPYVPPPLAVVSTYDKVSGFSRITVNRAVPVPGLNGTVCPVVSSKDGTTLYGLQVHARTDEAPMFARGAAASFYARGAAGENRDTIPELAAVDSRLVDYTHETEGYKAFQMAGAVGALASMFAGSSAYYHPPQYQGPRYEHVHYWETSFIIPLKRETFRQILGADEVIFRINGSRGSTDLVLPYAARTHFRLVEAELERLEAPKAPETPAGASPAARPQA